MSTSFSWETPVTDKTGGDFEIAPEGNHAAVCVAIVDLGTHRNNYQGNITDNRQVLFVWELANEKDLAGNTFLVCERYNVPEKFYQQSKLRQLLESWRGKPYAEGETPNWGRVLGAPCLVNVVHKEVGKKRRIAAVVDQVTPLPKGMAVPKPTRELFGYRLEMGAFRDPGWLPYIYGQQVFDLVKTCKEVDPDAYYAAGQMQVQGGERTIPEGINGDVPF